MNLVTPIGKIFLSIINKCFPPDHPLRKICNRNTLKISYSCMPSMGSAIARHNTKLLNDGKESVTSPTCNCRGGTLECPVNGQCLNQNVIYRAAVTTTHDNNSEFYTGLTSRTFKRRLYEHRTDSNNAARRTKTALSGHVWDLKDSSRTYNTTWNIMDRAPPYNPITRKCRLCLKEKFYIMYTPHNATLNKRDEIWTPCRNRFKDNFFLVMKTLM